MEVKIENNSARIIPDAKINLTNSKLFKDEFFDLIGKDITDITLDFKNVEEIDSSGLGKILLFNKVIKEKEGNLKIENVNSEYVQKVFNMVDLQQILTIE